MGAAPAHRYLIALGSNQRRAGMAPRAIISAAIAALAGDGWNVESVSSVLDSAPVGPSLRRYANAAAVIAGDLDPGETLASLRDVELRFGRQRRGQRWRARPLDLDLILWSDGAWSARELTIPHPRFRERDFVLVPSAQIAPDWRDPLTGLTIRQLAARAS